ncbi:MAG: M23 family metallopeptidase [Deltaproteobacteria bacterium]|jgi:murein DD-endopeptidase MepM/ murein hydrolase activator NlpD|nr:M23 family metallopeptidase [Deltaproteobacteria bacterium]
MFKSKKKLTPVELAEIKKLNNKAFWIAFVIFTLFIIIPALVISLRIYKKYLENDAPTLKIIQAPAGFGLAKSKIILEVSDKGAGLDEVVIRATERGVNRTILNKRYEFKQDVYQDRIEVELSGKSKDKDKNSIFPFKTGKIEVKVFDKSFWSNSAEASWEYLVDVTAPRIAAYTTQHNGTQGGSELIVYRVEDKNLVESGIKIRNQYFKGFPLAEYSPEYEKAKNAYFVFYAIPLDFNPRKDIIRLYARDSAGNEKLAKFKYNTRRVSQTIRNLEISKEFLEKAGRVYEQYYLAEAETYKIEDNPNLNLEDKFKLLNTEFLKLTTERIRTLTADTVHAKLWNGSFNQINNTLSSLYGDKKNFYFNSNPLSSVITKGLEVSLHTGSEVLPLAEGVVVFTGKLGVYGKAVIIDHGFGLSSMYGYLSESYVRAGDSVQRESVLGKSGNSGLAAGAKLYLAVLVQGQAVSPIEWWDRSWVKDHVLNKLADVKNDLGVSNTDEVDFDWVVIDEEEEELDP